MNIQELIEEYIITTERTITGIQHIKRHKITNKMGTIEFLLANRYFLNRKNMRSCFEVVKQVFERIFQQTNTKFRVEYKEEMSICKVLIII